MKHTEIRLNVQMLDSLDDLIGKTITEADSDENYSIVICNNVAVLTVQEHESGSCGDYGRDYMETSVSPIYELGVETCHALGILNEEDYQEYKEINDAVNKKKADERKRLQEEKEKIAADYKRAADYKKYIELKNQFEENKKQTK
jgi:hypothetical protein